MKVWIPGTPATFATRGEKLWREAIRAQLAGVIPPGTALHMQFVLPETDAWKRVADIDNFCEPVFCAVVNRVGWLGGRRPNLRWWHAEKRYAANPGLQITFLDGAPTPAPVDGPIVFEGRFAGTLPSNARDATVPGWLVQRWHGPAVSSDERLAVELRFADSRVNIGDIATGKVKALIDCLFPVIGGSAGVPHDWKIDQLIVSKTPGTTNAGVDIRISRK